MEEKVLKHFKKIDPILFEAAEKVLATSGPFTMQVPQDYFASLCDHIASQQLSMKAADTILNRFFDLFPDRKPTPQGTLDLTDEAIRAAGFSRAKIIYLKDLAQRIVNGVVELDRFQNLDNETIKTELIKVRGIGPWTAEMFLIFNLGRPDVFSPGDLGLKNAMIKLYDLNNPKPAELSEIAEKWSPHRSFACRILWRYLSL